VLSADVDYFFTSVFAMESVFKSLAFGMIQDKGSYLRETWS
jgi:Ion transport protein